METETNRDDVLFWISFKSYYVVWKLREQLPYSYICDFWIRFNDIAFFV